RLRPVAPLGHRLLHRPEEVIHAGVADELEALLQVRRELLVIVERAQVLFDPSVPLELEQRVGVMHDRRDLRSAADDALVLCELVDLAVTEACDALGLEVVERLLRRWPLHVDDAPVHAGLEDRLRKLLEIVVDALRRDLRRWPFHSYLPGVNEPTGPVARRLLRCWTGEPHLSHSAAHQAGTTGNLVIITSYVWYRECSGPSRRMEERRTAGPCSVLVVEDDDDLRALMTEVIRNAGWLPLEAATGVPVVDLVRQHAPRLVILDVFLPGLCGY